MVNVCDLDTDGKKNEPPLEYRDLGNVWGTESRKGRTPCYFIRNP